MEALATAFLYALVAALCLILIALLATVLRGRNVAGEGAKGLPHALVPIALALLLWLFIRWPSSHIWDQMMLASAFVLVALGIGRLILFLVRFGRFRQKRDVPSPKGHAPP